MTKYFRPLSFIFFFIVALVLLVILQPGITPMPVALAANNGLGQSPYMGWSSWSFIRGGVTQAKIEAQADAMASKLKSFGYTYINIDSGWTSGYDSCGRRIPDMTKFPSGIIGVANYVHSKGLKLGIYLLPGMNKDVYTANDQICGTSLHVKDITDTTQNGDTEGDAYRIDYSKPGATQYIQSFADLVASWGVDFIKMDFVGPGGGKVTADNREDMKQWMTALKNTKRPIWLELSNSLSFADVTTWQAVSNGWRITGDIECYSACNNLTLTNWAKVSGRFSSAPKWVPFGGPGGWNDFDSLEVGNGTKTGLTTDEQQTMMTLWAISASPLSLGTDLTNLDSTGLDFLTNTEVIAVDQAGRPASPISQATSQQVWTVKNADGSYTVAFFNLGTSPATVTVKWSDLGLSGSLAVRDLWSRQNLGSFNGSFSASLNTHAARLLRITPNGTNTNTPTFVPPTATNTPTNTPTSTATKTSTPVIGLKLSGLTVSDTPNAANWSIQSNLKTGATTYGDRTYTFNQVPVLIQGAAWISTANASKGAVENPLVKFTISTAATAYVGMDKRVTLPAWVDSSWKNTGQTVTLMGDTTVFTLYSKSFAAGTISLGPNGTTANPASRSMYLIAVK